MIYFLIMIAPGLIRDMLFIIRIMTIIICFYLSFQIGKRIKESSVISATFGLMLYFSGFAFFQIGYTLIIFYPDEQYSEIINRFCNYGYLIIMGFFSFFSEIEQEKYEKKNQSNLFAYKWSLISLFIIFLSIFLNIAIHVKNLSFGFGLMAIPFALSAFTFFRKFKTLKFLKKKRPDYWFILGLLISGISNFVYAIFKDPILQIIVQGPLVIAGTLMIARGWSLIPPLSELKWYLKLNHILIIHQDSSLVLFSYIFQESMKKGEQDSDQNRDQNRDQNKNLLTGGALGGIQALLKEILNSNQLINEIDHGDNTIYFSHGKKITSVLFTVGKSTEFHERLTQFNRLFEEKYHIPLQSWNGNLGDFSSTDKIIEQAFL